jgi:hypothetical protein
MPIKQNDKDGGDDNGHADDPGDWPRGVILYDNCSFILHDPYLRKRFSPRSCASKRKRIRKGSSIKTSTLYSSLNTNTVMTL